MDVAAQNVEARLGEASRNCNSRLLERKAKNLKGFNDMMDKRGIGSFVEAMSGDPVSLQCMDVDREKYTFAAQLAILQACPSVISRLLHNDQGDSCLLAAKVFVISRLLLKSLSEKVLASCLCSGSGAVTNGKLFVEFSPASNYTAVPILNTSSDTATAHRYTSLLDNAFCLSPRTHTHSIQRSQDLVTLGGAPTLSIHPLYSAVIASHRL